MQYINDNFNSNYIKQSYIGKHNTYKKEIDIFIVYIYIFCSIAMCVFVPEDQFTTTLYYSAVILGSVAFAGFAQYSRTALFFKVNMFFSFAILYFTLGFRDFSGIDDSSYIIIFNDVLKYGWITKFLETTMEPGYLLLNSMVATFTDNYLYMQLLISFIPLFLFYYGFKKYRHLISIPTAVFLLNTMLFFQMLSVSLVRMFIAMSIVFIAFDYIPKRKPIKYICLILLASLFHYSAFFMLILCYFAINKKNLSKKVIRTYTFFFITAPLVFLIISKLLVPLLGNRYANYGVVESVDISLSTFTTIPLILLLLLFYKKFYGVEQLYFKLFLTIYALSLIISLFGGMVSLGRLIFYSYTAFILGAAMVGKVLTRDSKKLIYSSVIICYGFLYVYVTQFTLEIHVPYLYPYQNIFFTF